MYTLYHGNKVNLLNNSFSLLACKLAIRKTNQNFNKKKWSLLYKYERRPLHLPSLLPFPSLQPLISIIPPISSTHPPIKICAFYPPPCSIHPVSCKNTKDCSRQKTVDCSRKKSVDCSRQKTVDCSRQKTVDCSRKKTVDCSRQKL